ncbi:MAG: AAA family ATPase [Elusimicrobia bacterium]|nr:AAA family ATPase [Elusimicrobiota bacterium]
MKSKYAQKFFERFLELIEIERLAERDENMRELGRFPLETRVAMGKTVTGLELVSVDDGVGGTSLLKFTRSSKGEEISPFHSMGPGDLVMVAFPAGFDPKTMEATLYKVEDSAVTASVNGPGPSRLGPGCQIDLIGSEATYKQMKRALTAVLDAKKSRLAALRDIALGKRDPKTLGAKRWRDPFNDALNEYQREAVRTCLEAEDVALVHGPPGTGKTTVLVELIRQAAALGQKVLATAPSNVAVDNVLEKLLATGLRCARLGHPARTLESLREANLAHMVEADPSYDEVRELDLLRERLARKGSRFGRGQLGYGERQEREREIRRLWRKARDIEFELSAQIVAGAHVVLGTHAGISRKLADGAFDLVVLDEASQATEPLSWVPLTMARKAVFAGDSMQLPPTIYSQEAAKGGLSTTLFERLKSLLPSDLQTLLRVQYRMHETIMGFPSREFYDDKLIADESVRTHTAAGLEGVAAGALTESPLHFIDTAGAGFDETWNELLESRENPGEAKLAVKIASALLASGIRPKDLAILTPYVAQARLLKSLLRVPGLEIGSVDGFQGREKEAAVVSLVRSNNEAEVGFLADVRRMNVAITRSRRLLVMIGDSATLAQHPFYSRFIDYADLRGIHRSAYEF